MMTKKSKKFKTQVDLFGKPVSEYEIIVNKHNSNRDVKIRRERDHWISRSDLDVHQYLSNPKRKKEEIIQRKDF